MSEQVKNFIDKLSLGQAAEAGEAFKDALRDKVGDALEARRKELAGVLFQGQIEAEAHSEPKPEVAEPFAQTAAKLSTVGDEAKN
jgi:hypothetical protein